MAERFNQEAAAAADFRNVGNASLRQDQVQYPQGTHYDVEFGPAGIVGSGTYRPEAPTQEAPTPRFDRTAISLNPENFVG